METSRVGAPIKGVIRSFCWGRRPNRASVPRDSYSLLYGTDCISHHSVEAFFSGCKFVASPWLEWHLEKCDRVSVSSSEWLLQEKIRVLRQRPTRKYSDCVIRKGSFNFVEARSRETRTENFHQKRWTSRFCLTRPEHVMSSSVRYTQQELLQYQGRELKIEHEVYAVS